MFINKSYLFIVLALFASTVASAQDKDEKKLLNSLKKLKNFSIGGYAQFDFQAISDVNNGGDKTDYSGGDFAKLENNRFRLRRGRFKVQYDGSFTKFVYQVDVNDKGLSLKDLYFVVPVIKNLKLWAGYGDVAFGNEVQLSSSKRESPERARIFQTLFKGEKDLGFYFIYTLNKSFEINAGLLSGYGSKGYASSIFDSAQSKNLLIRLRHTGTFGTKNTYRLGLSYLSGFYNLDASDIGQDVRVYEELNTNGSAKTYNDKYFAFIPIAKTYYGLEWELNVPWPSGKTTLRGEALLGTQPGSESKSESPLFARSGASIDGIYVRNFFGAYVYLVHRFGKKIGAVIKYDYYDPNTQITETNLKNPASNLSQGDIAFNTLGFGLFSPLSKHLTLTVYYEWVKNELTSTITEDYKDNVFTLRLQYKL